MTVAKYQHLIDEFASRVAEPAALEGEAARQPVIVKFATCQITAPAAAGDAGTSGVQRAPGRPALRLVVGGPAPPVHKLSQEE